MTRVSEIMSISSRACLLLSLLSLLASSSKLMAAEEPTRTFPAQKCRYTLPGQEWMWINKQLPNALFIAGNNDGFVITLSIVSGIGNEQVNERFAK